MGIVVGGIEFNQLFCFITFQITHSVCVCGRVAFMKQHQHENKHSFVYMQLILFVASWRFLRQSIELRI